MVNTTKLLHPDILETERFVLYPVHDEHKEHVYSILSNLEVRKSIYLPTLTDKEEYKEWWENRAKSIENHTLLQWCAFFKSNQAFCGLLTIKEIDQQNHRAEVGYSILPEYWRMGCGSELVEKVVTYGFEELNLHTFFAQILTSNMGSQKIVNRLGFSKEAHFTDLHFYQGQFHDILQFSKINPHHLFIK
jgi:ribosomal-protein-alanine N-acetyltransferase